MKSSNMERNKSEKIPDMDFCRTEYGMYAPEVTSMAQIKQSDADSLAGVGVHVRGHERSGTMILRNTYTLCAQSESKGLELLPIAAALKKYEWLGDKYYFKAVPAELDEATKRCAGQKEPHGYFIRVQKGARVTLPCQAAFYMASENITQMVHNVVILEDDSELQLITGCVTQHDIKSGLHTAVEEQYIGKNARLTSTMVHGWGSDVVVYPRAGTIVEAGGRYESNYISLRPAGQIISNPQTWLNGKGASAKYLTIILGSPGSTIDIGGDVYLNADGATAELAHRGVCTGGKMHQKGMLIGNASCKAHVDCAGMLLNEGKGGFIESIPGIKAHHPDARLSHEASIGKIAPEQVEYLQSRGMEEREAISMLIRGFLGSDIEGLGTELDARIAEIAELAGHGEG